MSKVDFGTVFILATGDKSSWRLWRLWRQGKSQGPYVLEKMGGIVGKNSTIPNYMQFRGSKALITQKGIALFQGRKLIIKTSREGHPKIPKSQ